MVFNEFLIIFDIRNITQSAYSFNGTPVIKLQPIVSSILGHVFSIVSCLHFYRHGFTGTKSGIALLIFALEQKLKVHWNGLQKTFLLSYYIDGRKCSHFMANYNSFFKLIFKQSRV